jgi:ribosomal protein S18
MIKKKSNLLNRQDLADLISWKALPLLKEYLTRFDNIKPRKYSQHSVRIQKKLRKSLIRARELGLIAYTQ